ncbi:Sjogren's syndrome/scleroderma autoantigen 1 family protein [Methanolobus sp. ZRKC2]|uniref:Sjogren's syndrome/scleroderma autoantigen 1 family protein n=1 Tax=Methanolobus sp. ZRKC2 TaxID=3125783 RepID=UPI003246789C
MTNTDDDTIKKISRMLEIGGTMLAQHCGTCGAPMFRYHGNVICPVCDSVDDPRARLQQKQDSEPSSDTKIAPISPEISSLPVEPVETKKQVVMEDTTKTDALSQESRPESSKYSLVQSDSSSAVELESLLMEKMISLANSMRSEDDVRKISDYMDIMERILSIIEKMKKTL